jgi:hypothetical protein
MAALHRDAFMRCRDVLTAREHAGCASRKRRIDGENPH